MFNPFKSKEDQIKEGLKPGEPLKKHTPEEEEAIKDEAAKLYLQFEREKAQSQSAKQISVREAMQILKEEEEQNKKNMKDKYERYLDGTEK